MCNGKQCPVKNSCYRYIAKPSQWQSYFTETPYDFEKEECEYIWYI